MAKNRYKVTASWDPKSHESDIRHFKTPEAALRHAGDAFTYGKCHAVTIVDTTPKSTKAKGTTVKDSGQKPRPIRVPRSVDVAKVLEASAAAGVLHTVEA
jgi:hypothetical protein